MKLRPGKCHPVDIYGAGLSRLRDLHYHSRGICHSLLGFPVAIMPVGRKHVDVFYPYGPPPLEICIEIKMTDFVHIPVHECKDYRLIHRLSIVDPHHQACPIDFHGGLYIRTVAEDQLGG